MNSPTSGFPTLGDVRVLGCVVASLAMHAALLHVPWGYQAERAVPAQRTSAVAVYSKVLDARLVLEPRGGRPPIRAATKQPDSPVAAQAEEESTSAASADSSAPVGLSLPAPRPIVDPFVYYTADKLSRQPQVLSVFTPDFSDLLPPGFRGSVRLTLFINKSGTVDRVAVGESTLSTDIDGAISRRFLEGRFAPGQIDGIPVKAEFAILVEVSSER